MEFVRAMSAIMPLADQLENYGSINPLHHVAVQGRAEDLQMMIKFGADIHRLDDSGSRIIKHCLLLSNVRTYDYLAPLMPRNWMNETDSRGRTLLHYVFERCVVDAKAKVAIVERMLTAGADPHVRDDRGNLPQDIARHVDLSLDLKTRRVNAAAGVTEIADCENISVYLKALKACKYLVDIDDDGDMYWPAPEGQ